MSGSSTLSDSGPVNYVDDYGVNPVGNGTEIGSTGYYAGGTYDSVGVSVTPSAGTSVTASQGGTTYNIPFLGGAAFPNQFYKNLPLNLALTGSWTLTLDNPDAPNSGIQVSTPTLAVTTPPDPVFGISISGNELDPTISWSIPTDSDATLETVFIFAVTPGERSGGAFFASAELSAGTTSYTLPASTLTAGSLYSVSIQSDVIGKSTGALEARTREFTAPFTASSSDAVTPIYIPDIAPSTSPAGQPIYEFDVPVSEGVPIVIDPSVAAGFIYQTGPSDPNFSSVELPDIGNSEPYSLYIYDGSQFVFQTTLSANTVFNFAPGGVSEFEVLGIDPSVDLSTTNASDFATQLTFATSGTFTGTMTPVVACYVLGTNIVTSEGDTPIESLSPGDNIVTFSGQQRPLRWIGHRSYAGRFLASNPGVQPIRFRAGCLGDGLPRRDLLVSPEHAMFLDGLLVPARCLVNGTTITQERGLKQVDYFHVELDSHDVVLAEGAPSESYADDGDSYRFHNAAERPAQTEPVTLCAPRVESGFALEAIRQRLAGAAGEVARAA